MFDRIAVRTAQRFGARFLLVLAPAVGIGMANILSIAVGGIIVFPMGYFLTFSYSPIILINTRFSRLPSNSP